MAAAKPSRGTLSRLTHDLKELKENPIIGANAEPLEDNLTVWYAIVMGASGSPYEGIPIRVVLEFPSDYPNSAPKAFFETFIAYEHGATFYDNGRLAVCLNIFGNFGHVHTEWKDAEGEGWSPAYSVSSILVAMQGLMLSDMFSTQPADIERTKKEASAFKCPITGHDGSAAAKFFPRVSTQEDPVDQAAKGIAGASIARDALQDHYICYVTKATRAAGAVLGYGIHVERGISCTSPCEYLSKEAFDAGTRQSSLKKPFEFWLPILISEADWPVCKPLFLAAIDSIAAQMSAGKRPAARFEHVLKICASVLSNLVVEVMNNRNNLSANDKFIDGYFALYRLLAQYARDEPALCRHVDEQLKQFGTNPDKRVKAVVPNLGEFLVNLLISQYTWGHIAQAFVQESDARNVFWYGVGNRQNPPSYPELIDPRNKDDRRRCEKTFAASEIGRHLIMFQVRFCQVAKSLTAEVLESNRGLAPQELRGALKSMYGDILKVGNWEGYIRWLGGKYAGDEARRQQLIAAVGRSLEAGYHKK